VPWVYRLPASILAGLTLVRLFIIFHDHEHGAILRGSALAHLLLTACGILLLTPRSIWRQSHNHHHHRSARVQSTGIGTFPLMTSDAYQKASWLRRWIYAVHRHPLTILLGYLTVFLFGMCLAPFLRSPRQHLDCGLAFVVHVALVAVLAVMAPGILIWTLLLPLVVATGLGTYLFYAQHNFPAARFQEGNSFDVVAAGLAASSYIPMSGLMRWFTGNIGYHHVHHLNARIPFYRLPEVMENLVELQSPGTTSLSPRGIYRCLRLKLWDSQQQRMVNFSGA
jgi:omega-6 fatty acid desaturase (delta-12 desaturase)